MGSCSPGGVWTSTWLWEAVFYFASVHGHFFPPIKLLLSQPVSFPALNHPVFPWSHWWQSEQVSIWGLVLAGVEPPQHITYKKIFKYVLYKMRRQRAEEGQINLSVLPCNVKQLAQDPCPFLFFYDFTPSCLKEPYGSMHLKSLLSAHNKNRECFDMQEF